jgi:hypothetical protein
MLIWDISDQYILSAVEKSGSSCARCFGMVEKSRWNLLIVLHGKQNSSYHLD